MKIDFSQVVYRLNGLAFKDFDDEKLDLTLRAACVKALLTEVPKEKKVLTGEDKFKRYRMATKIYGCKEPIGLSSEKVALLKELMADVFVIELVGRCYVLLEGEGEKSSGEGKEDES